MPLSLKTDTASCYFLLSGALALVYSYRERDWIIWAAGRIFLVHPWLRPK
jgi:hypothetical protein